jgi:hypothetical protein
MAAKTREALRSRFALRLLLPVGIRQQARFRGGGGGTALDACVGM